PPARLPHAHRHRGRRGRRSRPPRPLIGPVFNERKPAGVVSEHLVLGTAGHIDHGKTWLVRALTGIDTDRLPEEKARGISIDLGYAPLLLPDGRRLSLIDAPGHERFVRNMVAGATGIDLFLLVIDAAEGARPQTLEHLTILRLLGIEQGVVAVTKADAVGARRAASPSPCAASRCPTSRSSGPRPDSGLRFRCPASSASASGAATPWSNRASTRSRTASTWRSRSSRRSRTARACTSTT